MAGVLVCLHVLVFVFTFSVWVCVCERKHLKLRFCEGGPTNVLRTAGLKL